MILADTSIWIDHLRHGDAELVTALQQSQILVHPFVLGEMACGHLRNRNQILSLLDSLPMATMASDAEVRAFIEQYALMGRGIGYIDAHLCASARLSAARLWTRDKRLHAVASELGWAHQETSH
jgi:hypothetical protein